MPVSQNGWSTEPKIVSQPVPGTTMVLPVREGLAGDWLIWVAGQFHTRVEPLVTGWCWGYAARDIRGSSVISNHASGTAVDLNAPRHPLGTEPTANFTAAQITEIRKIVSGTPIRWGGDYTGRKDPMHFEIRDGLSPTGSYPNDGYLNLPPIPGDTVNLSDRLPDLYTKNPTDTLTVADTLAWSAAHAATARDAAQDTNKKLDDLITALKSKGLI